jgi:hypothetical protein
VTSQSDIAGFIAKESRGGYGVKPGENLLPPFFAGKEWMHGIFE